MESIVSFFSTTAGAASTAVISFILLIVLAIMMSKKANGNETGMIKPLTYSAICIALALILSNVKLFSMPYGGSVKACSMLFIALVGYWIGPVEGIIAGVTYGMIDLTLNPYVIHPMQLLLDYPLAFGAIGISGFFKSKKNGLQIGFVAGALGRFFMSFLSGFIFFGEYAPEGMNVYLYSFVYNMSYILPEIIITLVIISIPAFYSAINKVKNQMWSSTLQ